VSDGVNKPWYVASSGCSATPLVGTNIQVDSVPSAWQAYGAPVVYDARLFFILNSSRDTIVWSEVADPTTGYQQTNFANYWELFQTDPRPIYALAPTETSLVVLRARSILTITGKTDQSFATNATKEAVEGVGTTCPASVIVHNETVWFLDELGRQYRYSPGSEPQALWPQLADAVQKFIGGGNANTAAIAGAAVYHPDLDLVVSMSWAALGFLTVASQFFVFDATSGRYQGVWDVDGGKLLHSIGVVRDSSGNSSLCVLGESSASTHSTANSGQMWRQRSLNEMISGVGPNWSDPNGVPSTSVTAHHLGRNEEMDWRFDRLMVRAVQINAVAAGRTLSLAYLTPRLQSSTRTAVLSYPPAQFIQQGGVSSSTFVAEAWAVFGLGPDASGNWLMPTVSAQTTSALAVPPFTITAIELRGTSRPANPYIGIGAPGPATFSTITDSFNRINSALTLGTTDTGHTWQYLSTGVWGIAANQAYNPTNSVTNKDAAVVQSLVSDCSVQVTFATHVSSMRVGFRYTDLNNGFIVNDEGSQYVLYRLQSGSYTSIGSTTLITPTNGDVIKVTLSGSSITVYVNGVSKITATDTFNQTATLHGIASNDNTAVARWDTFSITVP